MIADGRLPIVDLPHHEVCSVSARYSEGKR
jgi:hypothetical protein